MGKMFKKLCVVTAVGLFTIGNPSAANNHSTNNNDKFMEEKLNLAQEWDKVFLQSDKVNHK